MLKIIDRYFLSEQLKPFLAGVSAFLIIMISNTLYIFMEMIVKNNVPFKTVVRLLLYSLPAIVVVTLPVAYMFATLLSLGRLGRDSEIIALRACGVSLTRCIMPVIIMSIVISAFGFVLQENVVPWANQQTVAVLKDVMKRDPAEIVVEKRFLDSDKRSFYVENVDREKGELQQIYVLDKSEQGFPQIIEAQKASKKEVRWELFNGILRKLDHLGFVDHEIKFDRMEIELDIKPDRVFSDRPDVRSQSMSDARDTIEEKRKKGENVNKDLVDYHTKFSLPLATFFTILLAAPIGIKFSRMGNYFGVAISIALVFVWYVLYSTFSSLGGTGKVDPILASWIQNITFGGLGILFLLQMSGLPVFKVLFFPLFLPGWLKEQRESKKARQGLRQTGHNPYDRQIVPGGLRYLFSSRGILNRKNFALLSLLTWTAAFLSMIGFDLLWPQLMGLLMDNESLRFLTRYQNIPLLNQALPLATLGVYAFVGLVTLNISLSLGAKRAHHLGRSGWLQLWHLVPGVGSLYLTWLLFFKPGLNIDNEGLSEAGFDAESSSGLSESQTPESDNTSDEALDAMSSEAESFDEITDMPVSDAFSSDVSEGEELLKDEPNQSPQDDDLEDHASDK